MRAWEGGMDGRKKVAVDCSVAKPYDATLAESERVTVELIYHLSPDVANFLFFFPAFSLGLSFFLLFLPVSFPPGGRARESPPWIPRFSVSPLLLLYRPSIWAIPPCSLSTTAIFLTSLPRPLTLSCLPPTIK